MCLWHPLWSLHSLNHSALNLYRTGSCQSFKSVMPPAQRGLPWPPTSSGSQSLVLPPLHRHHHQPKHLLSVSLSTPPPPLEPKPPESRNSSDLFTALCLWLGQSLARSRCTDIFIGLISKWVWSGRLVPSAGLLLARPDWGWEVRKRRRGEAPLGLEAAALDGNGLNPSDLHLGDGVARFSK